LDLGIDTNTPICDSAAVFTLVVRKLRRDKGWTVEELATRAGVGKMTVSSIERGQSNYRRQTLELIAVALGTDVDALHARLAAAITYEAKALANAAHSDDITPAEREHLRVWRSLSEESRAEFSQLIARVAESDTATHSPTKTKTA
jgi:transcriptional regulator with XRE-family HTH domain